MTQGYIGSIPVDNIIPEHSNRDVLRQVQLACRLAARLYPIAAIGHLTTVSAGSSSTFSAFAPKDPIRLSVFLLCQPRVMRRKFVSPSLYVSHAVFLLQGDIFCFTLLPPFVSIPFAACIMFLPAFVQFSIFSSVVLALSVHVKRGELSRMMLSTSSS